MKTLETLFLDELADIYDAETRLTKALPKMAKAATHTRLREAFETHLSETEGHVQKVERVFGAFGQAPKPKRCKAMVGLVKEGDSIATDNEGESTINAALVSAAQKVEHYEIASYGCLREWAQRLGNQEAVGLLQEILGEEKNADTTLTELARECYNLAAAQGGSDAGSDEDADTIERSGSYRPSVGVR